MKNSKAIFSICCYNYLQYAKSLFDSIKEIGEDADLYLILCEEGSPVISADFQGVTVLLLADIGIEEYLHYAFKFSLLELNTNIKPSVFELFGKKGYREVIYFDPDICVYSSLEGIWNTLKISPIAVTPHVQSEYQVAGEPNEVDFLKTGIFNLGFIAVSFNCDSLAFLSWWRRSCLSEGYKDFYNGVFVDQKWCDLLVSFCPRVAIMRNPGLNVAYWNLHEREISLSEGKYYVNKEHKLVFFHFSGIDPMLDSQISKYTNRFDLSSRTDLVELFRKYRKGFTLFSEKNLLKKQYSFACLSDGSYITPLLRRLYGSYISRTGTQGSPFEKDHQFYQSLWYVRLTRNRTSGSAGINRKVFNSRGILAKTFVAFLKGLIFLAGIGRAELFLKGMHHFCNFGNCADLLVAEARPIGHGKTLVANQRTENQGNEH